jgi:hypothetical protein
VSARRTSREAIATIALGLGDLCRDAVFVGGAAASLFDDYEGADVRATDDVDCILEIHSVAEYERLSRRLRKSGFRECDDEGAPRCRWVFAGIRVDVMSTEGTAMGFSSRWYPELVKHALSTQLTSGDKSVTVRHVSPLYFVATKIEAYLSRGKGDFFASHDLEDLVAVLTASKGVRVEITSSSSTVCRAVRSQLIAWRDHEDFRDATFGHLAGNERAYDRLVQWLASLQEEAAP